MDEKVYGALSRINAATGKKFVVIIEWDVLIRDEALNQKVQDEYRLESSLREVSRQIYLSLLI